MCRKIEAPDGKHYIDLIFIRLIFLEDGTYVGWYRPGRREKKQK